MKFLISCEHASNAIPEEYQQYFKGKLGLLRTHEGYDIGIAPIASYMATMLGAEVYVGEYSRLLVDLNRTQGRRGFFSSITQPLSQAEKDDIVEKYYLPYRNAIFNQVESWADDGELVIHLAIHSFTPYLYKEERQNMIGLLYDPHQRPEFKLCKRMKKIIRRTNRKIKIRMNYPYLGTSDALTTYLRSEFEEDEYIGIEVEFNQKYVRRFQEFANIIIHALKHSIHKVDRYSNVKIGHKNIHWL